MVQLEGGQAAKQERNPRSQLESYRRAYNNLTELHRALTENWDYDGLDPAMASRLQRAYEIVHRAMAAQPALGKDAIHAIEALLVDIENDIQTLEGTQPKEVNRTHTPELTHEAHRPQRRLGEKVLLPRLGDRVWQIIRVDTQRGTYIIADPNDRTPVEYLITDIRSGKEGGYELKYQDFEDFARSSRSSARAA